MFPLPYSLVFGGILPLDSLVFARILANTAEAETRANASKQRFAAVGDLAVQLFAHEKRQNDRTVPTGGPTWRD